MEIKGMQLNIEHDHTLTMSNAKFEAYENPAALHQCDESCDTRIFETRLPRNQSDGHERKIRQGGTQNRLWTACKDDRIIVISSY